MNSIYKGIGVSYSLRWEYFLVLSICCKGQSGAGYHGTPDCIAKMSEYYYGPQAEKCREDLERMQITQKSHFADFTVLPQASPGAT